MSGWGALVIDRDCVKLDGSRRVHRLEAVVVHECDLRIVLVKKKTATFLGGRALDLGDDLVRAGVEEGDKVVVDVLLAIGREGAVLGPCEHDRDLLRGGVDDARAGGQQ
eukprot:901636-Rhodomonas_salina.2